MAWHVIVIIVIMIMGMMVMMHHTWDIIVMIMIMMFGHDNYYNSDDDDDEGVNDYDQNYLKRRMCDIKGKTLVRRRRSQQGDCEEPEKTMTRK